MNYLEQFFDKNDDDDEIFCKIMETPWETYVNNSSGS